MVKASLLLGLCMAVLAVAKVAQNAPQIIVSGGSDGGNASGKPIVVSVPVAITVGKFSHSSSSSSSSEESSEEQSSSEDRDKKPLPGDCSSAPKAGVYNITLASNIIKEVMCVEDGWTVIQSRGQHGNPIDYFWRAYASYEAGFGVPGKEHWLGLKAMNILTSKKKYTLRVRLTDPKGAKGVAYYGHFEVGSSGHQYKLKVGHYKGNMGDRTRETLNDNLRVHNNLRFSAFDRDHDTVRHNCAWIYTGGWWFKSCHPANLNGNNYNSYRAPWAKGIVWDIWRKYDHSMREAEMAIKAL